VSPCRKDLTALGRSGAAVKAFAEFILSEEGQAMPEQFGFKPVPKSIVTMGTNVSGAGSPRVDRPRLVSVQHLKRRYEESLSNLAFNFNLRSCTQGLKMLKLSADATVGWCRLSL